MTQALIAGTRGACLAMLAACWQLSGAPAVSAQVPRLLSCAGPLRPDASAASLARAFGAGAVSSAEIEVGEGFTEPGTVVFADSPADRLEVLWLDTTARQRPARVIVRNRLSDSRWRTPGGLALGMHLRDIERMNGRPFRLLGFEWDYGGTVVSWTGGTLDSDQPSGCRVRARLTTGELRDEPQRRWHDQVMGDREFSSAHAAMQALDPFVHELWLDYREGAQLRH